MNTLVKKNFLNVNDVCSILLCSRGKGYNVIRDLNESLIKNGIKVYQGKVNARIFYESYGLDDLKRIHEDYTNIK